MQPPFSPAPEPGTSHTDYFLEMLTDTVSSRPNANAQVGRRFESDTSDSVSGPQSKERPDCSEKVINVRGVKKVIRNDSHLKSCPEADDLRTGDEDETIEDTGNTGGTFVGDEVDGTEELAEEERPLLPGEHLSYRHKCSRVNFTRTIGVCSLRRRG